MTAYAIHRSDVATSRLTNCRPCPPDKRLRKIFKQALRAVQDVCNGVEPSDVLVRDAALQQETGYLVHADIVLKVIKWIFIQEDCNYPTPSLGRHMALRDYLQSGNGETQSPRDIAQMHRKGRRSFLL